MYEKLSFNFSRDIAPVASIARVPEVMVVNLSVPARTILEFIAYAKSMPGKINMASASKGTPSHLAGEVFMMMTGVDMVHVAYRGGAPALTDLIGGQVQVMFVGTASTIEYIKASRLRALAVTTTTRSDELEGADPTAFGDGAVSPIATGEFRPRRRTPDRKDSIANNLRHEGHSPAKRPLARYQGLPLRGRRE